MRAALPGRPVAAYVHEVMASEPATRVTVLIPEAEPERLWPGGAPARAQPSVADAAANQRGAVVAHAVRRETDAVICRLRFRLL